MANSNPLSNPESLPLPIQAIGLCRFDGSAQPLGLRLEIEEESFCQLDSYRLFLRGEQLSLKDSADSWFQVPFATSPENPLQSLSMLCAQTMTDCIGKLILLPTQDILELEGSQSAAPTSSETAEKLRSIEESITQSNYLEAQKAFEAEKLAELSHPRALFCNAVLTFLSGDTASAAKLFHSSYQLGHPDGFDASLEMLKLVGFHMREKFPSSCKAFDESNYQIAMQELGSISDEYAGHRNALMAYCCRHTLDFETGLKLCIEALETGEFNSDIYSHKWTFETQTGMDELALATAKEHLSLYPTNPSAYVDALHSSLLLGELKQAKFFAFGYLTHAQNINIALKHLFTYFEYANDFAGANAIFSDLFPKLRSPTPESLMLYAEVLLEQKKSEEAFPLLERAMAAAPENADIVLSYARAFARDGKPHEATKFMESVVHDKNRNDTTPERFLFITLLSELYRNSGDRENALSLWPQAEEFNSDLLRSIGPRAFVEYGYLQAEMGNDELCQTLSDMLQAEHPNEHCVEEFRNVVCNLSC